MVGSYTGKALLTCHISFPDHKENRCRLESISQHNCAVCYELADSTILALCLSSASVSHCRCILEFPKTENSASLAFLLDVLELKNSDAIVKIRKNDQACRGVFENQSRYKPDS